MKGHILMWELPKSPESKAIESRFAATVVAPPPRGAGAHADVNQLQAVALNEGLRCKKKLWGDPDVGKRRGTIPAHPLPSDILAMLTVSWQLRLNHQIVGARLSGVCADVRHRHGPA